MSAPTVTVTNSDGIAEIKIELTILGWSELRQIADDAGCAVYEKRLGFFTKEFTMRGNQAQLQKLSSAIWISSLLGRDYRNEIRKRQK